MNWLDRRTVIIAMFRPTAARANGNNGNTATDYAHIHNETNDTALPFLLLGKYNRLPDAIGLVYRTHRTKTTHNRFLCVCSEKPTTAQVFLSFGIDHANFRHRFLSMFCFHSAALRRDGVHLSVRRTPLSNQQNRSNGNPKKIATNTFARMERCLPAHINSTKFNNYALLRDKERDKHLPLSLATVRDGSRGN